MLECLSGQEPVTVTLFNDSDNTTDVITICKDTVHTDPCLFLALLTTAGYTPADWDDECSA